MNSYWTEEECQAEVRSWDYFTPEQLDSYWIRCTLILPHIEHEDENTGLRWKTCPTCGQEEKGTHCTDLFHGEDALRRVLDLLSKNGVRVDESTLD